MVLKNNFLLNKLYGLKTRTTLLLLQNLRIDHGPNLAYF